MATLREPRLVSDVSEIADKIRDAFPRVGTLRPVVFLIGAGCSISAGIPGAIDLAKIMVREFAYRRRYCGENTNCVEAYTRLVDKGKLHSCLKDSPGSDATCKMIDWYKVSDQMFDEHYSAPHQVRELFVSLVNKTGGAINWAHLCLGELVAQKFISTVLTTNFDQLVLSGIVRTGVLPVVCDGIESLNRISGTPQHPQLVELHGSLHTYLLRNAHEDVEAVGKDPEASAKIRSLLQNAEIFVAIGYGGREEGVMDLLIQAAEAYRDKYLFWINRSTDPKDISDKVRQFLATSRNARLFLGQDADRFFLDLCRSLKIGAPLAILDPLEPVQRMIWDVAKSQVVDPDIMAAINAANARVDRLKECDKQFQERDPEATETAKIREKRLAGDFAEAYRMAKGWWIKLPMA